MDQPIMFTLQDVVTFFLAACGALITITTASAALMKIISNIKKPNKDQDEKIKTLEEDVKQIKERLEQGNKRFDSDTAYIKSLEGDMHESTKMIIISLQALMAHAIDGNNIDKLREAKGDLDKYLINKIK